MKCQNCGKEIEKEFVACPYCGEKVLTDETADMPFIIGGRFEFGKADYRKDSEYPKLNWDIVNVNKEQDYIDMICTSIIDIRKVNDYDIDFKDLRKSSLYEFLNGTFFFKTFSDKQRKVFKSYPFNSSYGENEKICIVIPQLDCIIDNDFTRIKIENTSKAIEEANRLKRKSDSFFVLNENELWFFQLLEKDKMNFDFYDKPLDYFTILQRIEDYDGVRPMIRVSIKEIKKLLENSEVVYVTRKEVLKSIDDGIERAIQDYCSERERAHDWAIENIPGIDENESFEPPTENDYRQHLESLGYFNHIIDGYFDKYHNKMI